MRAVLWGLLVVLASIACFADSDAEKLARMTVGDLLQARAKAEARIDIVDTYENAELGAAPETDQDTIVQAYQNFLTATHDWYTASILANGESANCSRYVANVRALLAELSPGYQRAQEQIHDGRDALLARARLEALGYFLLAETQLANSGAEGGDAPITGGFQCHFVNRTSWLLATNRVQDMLNSLSRASWGRRGIQHPYPLSQALLQILNRDEQSRNTWSVVKYAGEAVATLAALSFASAKIMPIVRSLLGLRFTKFLKVTSIIALGAYGGYRGYVYANKKDRDLGANDDWHHIQDSVEDLVELNPKDIESFYAVTRELEKITLDLNTASLTALQPDIQIAQQRFQTLANAKKIAQQKLTEIDSEIGRRKNENK